MLPGTDSRRPHSLWIAEAMCILWVQVVQMMVLPYSTSVLTETRVIDLTFLSDSHFRHERN